jgi:EmrB/QacA subfamily drug resistance transporter
MLALLLVLSGLDQTILSTALPSIVRSLQGQSLAPWVFSAYLMAATAAVPLYGKLADRWGLRPMLLLASGLFTLGSVACALAPTLPVLVAARALQGLGGGGLMTLSMLAVVAAFPAAERGRRMGGLGAAYSLATLLGPLAGGLLLEVAPWQAAFWLNVPLAALAWGVLRSALPSAVPAAKARFDHAGALLLVAGLVATLWATRRDATPQVAAAVGLLALTLALVWWRVERHAADPVVPPALFRNAGFPAAAGYSALSGVVLFGTVVLLPTYLQLALHRDALHSSLVMLPLMAGILIGTQIAGRALRAGLGPRRLGLTAATAMCAGAALLASTLAFASGQVLLMGAWLLPIGLGLGLGFPLVTLTAQRCAPAAHLGVATAVPAMLRALGGALGVAVLVDPAAFVHDPSAATALAFGGVAVAAFAGALLALAMPPRLQPEAMGKTVGLQSGKPLVRVGTQG